MTVQRHEILIVTSIDDDPKAIIDALLELPPGVRLIDVEHEAQENRFASPVTFRFQGKASDA